MAKAKISSKVLEELNRQMNQELAAAHSYLALSVWCDIRNFKGFAKYFVKQSDEERKHADRILKHLTDRVESAEVAAVPRADGLQGGRALFRQNVREGTWSITRGAATDPNATVYRLAPTQTEPALLLMKGADNVLFFLNQKQEPMVGHAEFSYTLNRVTKK
jgi:hypothetical protein